MWIFVRKCYHFNGPLNSIQFNSLSLSLPLSLQAAMAPFQRAAQYSPPTRDKDADHSLWNGKLQRKAESFQKRGEQMNGKQSQ